MLLSSDNRLILQNTASISFRNAFSLSGTGDFDRSRGWHFLDVPILDSRSLGVFYSFLLSFSTDEDS